MENSSKKQGNIIAILAMVFLFAMIAFVTNLCSPMAVILKNNFNVSEFLSQVGNYGNFGAYLVMGVPAGLLITKFGYKKTALMALIVGIVGLLLQWVSGSAGFVVYLIGAFISGLCMCMLNTVVNPMLNSSAEVATVATSLYRSVEYSTPPLLSVSIFSWEPSSATPARPKSPQPRRP